MNDMLGNKIEAGDTVIYDGAVCKVVTCTQSRMKYVTGSSARAGGDCYEHGTNQFNKVLKLNDFNDNLVQTKLEQLSDNARNYVTPAKRELSMEEKNAAALERSRRNKLKKDMKEFDIMATGHGEYYIYLGRHARTVDGISELSHVYSYVGYVYRSSESTIVDNILNNNNRTSYTLSYSKSKKQPQALISERHDELKTHLSSLTTDSGYYRETYTTVRNFVNSL